MVREGEDGSGRQRGRWDQVQAGFYSSRLIQGILSQLCDWWDRKISRMIMITINLEYETSIFQSRQTEHLSRVVCISNSRKPSNRQTS